MRSACRCPASAWALPFVPRGFTWWSTLHPVWRRRLQARSTKGLNRPRERGEGDYSDGVTFSWQSGHFYVVIHISTERRRRRMARFEPLCSVTSLRLVATSVKALRSSSRGTGESSTVSTTGGRRSVALRSASARVTEPQPRRRDCRHEPHLAERAPHPNLAALPDVGGLRVRRALLHW